MATSFDVIEDMGLGQIDDYALSKLYTNDFKKFQNHWYRVPMILKNFKNFVTVC